MKRMHQHATSSLLHRKRFEREAKAAAGDASAGSGLAGREEEAAGALGCGKIAELIDDVEGAAFAFLVDA